MTEQVFHRRLPVSTVAPNASDGDAAGDSTVPGTGAEWRYLNAMSDAVLVVDSGERLKFANLAAEQLLESGRKTICRHRLTDYFPEDSTIRFLVNQARASGNTVAENDAVLHMRTHGPRDVAIHANPVNDETGTVVICLRERAITRQIDRQLNHRNVARSVTAMASMMAHEVRNPLSGIKGAAQLLEGSVATDERALTRLICDEADRLNALVDRIAVFSDRPAVVKSPVNIHEVLGRVRTSAENGFGSHARILEVYDPSLPAVSGDRDRLIQIFMNLVKNAVEAVDAGACEITIRTAYRSGVRIAAPGNDRFVRLPIAVSVEDNGPGIPEDLRDHLFDPFVTTKASGTGLGLALVSKIVEEQGGVIEYGEENGRTAFRVLLPAHDPDGHAEGHADGHVDGHADGHAEGTAA